MGTLFFTSNFPANSIMYFGKCRSLIWKTCFTTISV